MDLCQINGHGDVRQKHKCLSKVTLYIYCMVVSIIFPEAKRLRGIWYSWVNKFREIWKFIHPRVSYFPKAAPDGNMILVGEYIFLFPEPACYKCFIIPNETKKTDTCKILLESIFFKCIGTLSQTFKNHCNGHLHVMRSECLWRFPVKER